ncbi:protein-L-isoaspartate O-methyltransferase family protein [Stygiolobus caldivivus]|uniref:protein-L-isoaspartate(D-aspartate) O-methyltransferase n=1 Tax=Stygiolobus caldivivus TaxID=2824673 RepID=A0A8D5U7J9_9CREN|nr:protein-L-isoaspartate O-methyltransferase [Stygiolobus caldivivus]BCU70773.1 protein-L-isoaspartate O-methyltransferase [Stygiolobus caldivivus]
MSEKEEVFNYFSRLINSKELLDAFKRVDRIKFIPEPFKSLAYSKDYLDKAIPITKNYNTTALSLGIMMLDLLQLRSGDKVLEIGTGSGYYTALIAEVVGGENVYSMEYDIEAYSLARANLSGYAINLILGDGSIGYEKAKPYDKIVVWAASPTFPYALYAQLRDRGIMVVPIADSENKQGLYKIVKGNEAFIVKVSDVIFSRLRGLCGYWY